MKFGSAAQIRIATLAIGTAALAACTTSTPPPQAYVPPPPPPRVVVPPRPTPPSGAVALMAIPSVGMDGVRQTVNTNISKDQQLWNLRSGLNVAALNCLKPQHVALVGNYRELLKKHSRELASTNRALQSEFRKRYGAKYHNDQDAYMTRVYNYFALPPALPKFCDEALSVSNDLRAVPTGKLGEFAATALPRLEAVFENFFRAYEQYRTDVAAWDARYAPRSTAIAEYGPVTNSLEARYPSNTVSSVPVSPSQPASSPSMMGPVDMGQQPQMQYAPGTGAAKPPVG